MLLEQNKIGFRIEKDYLVLEKPIYIYLNNDTNECALVKDEHQFRDINDGDQIIMKISTNFVEFYRPNITDK